MNIRKVNIEDSESYLGMLNQLDNETKYMMYEPGERKTSIDEMRVSIGNIVEANKLLLTVEDEGKLIGFLSANRGFANRIKHSAYIVIGILKEYRGKKIGTKLFEELFQWAASNQITRLELTVMTNNENAIKLYKKMGFKVEGLKEKSLMVDGNYIDEYYMAKVL